MLRPITVIHIQAIGAQSHTSGGTGAQPWSALGRAITRSVLLELPQGTERWVIVRTQASKLRAQGSLQRQVSRGQTNWAQKCWHLGNHPVHRLILALLGSLSSTSIKSLGETAGVGRQLPWLLVQTGSQALPLQGCP